MTLRPLFSYDINYSYQAASSLYRKKKHPRLYFSEEDRPRLKSLCETEEGKRILISLEEIYQENRSTIALPEEIEIDRLREE